MIVSSLSCWSTNQLVPLFTVYNQNLIFLWVLLLLQFIQKLGILCGLYQGENVEVMKFLYVLFCFVFLICTSTFEMWLPFLHKGLVSEISIRCRYLLYSFILMCPFMNAAYLQGFFHSWYVSVSSYSN